MTEANENVSENKNNNFLVVIVTIVALFIVFMYFRDKQQQRDLELNRIEKRVEVLEEWGPRAWRQNGQNNFPQNAGGRRF